MYAHILLPTDGSELSKMAIREGVGLAKALGARVTVVTVTTPFHVFSGSISVLTDTPEQYTKHMAARAAQYLDVAKKIAAVVGVPCVPFTHQQIPSVRQRKKILCAPLDRCRPSPALRSLDRTVCLFRRGGLDQRPSDSAKTRRGLLRPKWRSRPSGCAKTADACAAH
jgi:hypothetical protein